MTTRTTPKRRKDRSQPEADRLRPLFAIRLDATTAAQIRETAARHGVQLGTLVALAWALARRGGPVALEDVLRLGEGG